MSQMNVENFARKYQKVIILFLVLVSLIIDFGSMNIQERSLDFSSGQTPSWWEIAHNVETGAGYKACNENYIPNCAITEQHTAMREPLPVLLFALVGKLSHDSPFFLQLSVIAFYFLIFLEVFILGNRLGGVGIGLLNLFLWTFYLPQERIEYSLTGDLQASAIVTLGYLIFTTVTQTNRLRDWLGFGFVMGLAALSRSAMLVVAVTLIVGYVIYFRGKSLKFSEVVWKGLLSLVVLGMTLSPWIIRNYLVFKQPVIGTTLIGYNLYRHNAIVATNAPPHYVGSEEALQLVHTLVSRRPELQTPLDEVQVDSIFRQEAVKLILENPVAYGKLVLYRVLPLWFNIGIQEQYGNQMSVWDYLIILQQLSLLVAFAIGLKRGDRLLQLFGISTLVYSVSYLVIDSQLRYLVPIMPVVIIIGSIGIIKQWRLFVERKKHSSHISV